MPDGPPENPPAVQSRQVVRHIDGRDVIFDGEGFLTDPDAWSRPLAQELAEESHMGRLNPRQWQVIEFLREYYYTYGRAPMNRQMKEGTGLSLLELQELFPEGLKKGARRLAGLPNPKTCM